MVGRHGLVIAPPYLVCAGRILDDIFVRRRPACVPACENHQWTAFGNATFAPQNCLFVELGEGEVPGDTLQIPETQLFQSLFCGRGSGRIGAISGPVCLSLSTFVGIFDPLGLSRFWQFACTGPGAIIAMLREVDSGT